MYLKSLELHGFKSFPDKTVLTFERGSTVIVGPNGSGKSNLSDAMRWVLGEISSKSIRGTKMEDVIFSGADGRRPMGFAEVSVTFDNTGEGRLDSPYDEVTVTRRYYRAGESEYFINRKACRLRDIYELFMNTGIGRDGYSIIGQGKIAEMISRKSDERRGIFEDASGIARFRFKKSEAERRLASTEDNMLRVNDILSELEGRVGPLEKEAARARKYLDLYEEKKRADVSLWLYDTERLRADVANAEGLVNRSALELQTVDDTIASLEAQNEKLYEASQSNKLTSEQLLREIREQTNANHELDAALRVAENNRLHAGELIAAAQASAASAESAIAAEQAARQTHMDQIARMTAELSTARQAHDDLLAKQAEATQRRDNLAAIIDGALANLHAAETEQMNLQVHLSVLENTRAADHDKNATMQDDLASLEKTASDLGEQCEAARAAVEDYTVAVAELDETVSRHEQTLAELARARHEALERSNQLKLRQDSLIQRADTLRRMEEHFEGYSGSVRYVMNQYEQGKITLSDGRRCDTVYGPLSKLISVEPRYITAIETALGANLQNIVVEDEETAKAAIYALKRGNAGRATFYPITSMRPSSMTDELRRAAEFDGYLGTADALVGCDDRYRGVLSSLLGRTVIFDHIDHATAMAKATRYRVRAVTLDGQQINVGGSFTGGSAKRDSGILSRASEIEQLDREQKKVGAEVEAAQKGLHEIDEQIAASGRDRDDAAERRRLIGTMSAAEQARLDQLEAKREANQTLIDKIYADFAEQGELRRRYDEDIAARQSELTELQTRMSELSAFRADREIERNAADDEANELGEQITARFIRISEIEKDIETTGTLRAAVDERILVRTEEKNAAQARIAELQQSLRETEATMAANRTEAEAGEAHLRELNARRAEVEAGSLVFEQQLNDLRVRLRDQNNRKELVIREHTRNENKLAGLRAEQDKLSSRLWDDYELTRAGAIELGYPPVTEENRTEVAAVQTECRNKLRALGSVNVSAIEEYAEVKSRYDYLSGQLSDLRDAKADLEAVIARLEIEMRTAFLAAFDAINRNFNRVFAELFGGGSASLELTDPADPLTSGIEIKAAPPGKVIKSLMQLSGGEQSFIGVALFFAILQVNPTPFCILDEIEAALDEVNVARLAEYIKRYTGDTQFILITHRRGTMEVADCLYGVTMPERGISRVLALNIDDIEKKGEDWDGIFG
ncbi:MAG: chromosome segregation protein SMC [Clostridia bacterium]|nr:chromosome segregation protein SMC [Clostridia bacterium]